MFIGLVGALRYNELLKEALMPSQAVTITFRISPQKHLKARLSNNQSFTFRQPYVKTAGNVLPELPNMGDLSMHFMSKPSVSGGKLADLNPRRHFTSMIFACTVLHMSFEA